MFESETVRIEPTGTYNFRLETRDFPRSLRESGRNFDISGVKMEFPEHLDSIRIYMGGAPVVTFSGAYMNEFLSFPIYFSLCNYFEIDIELIYNKEWIQNQCQFHEVPAYREIITESTRWVEAMIRGEVQRVHPIKRRFEPTGAMEKVCVFSPEVQIPRIEFITCPAMDPRPKWFEMPVRQKIPIPDEASYLERLKEKYHLEIVNGEAFVTNTLRYMQGFAGLSISF